RIVHYPFNDRMIVEIKLFFNQMHESLREHIAQLQNVTFAQFFSMHIGAKLIEKLTHAVDPSLDKNLLIQDLSAIYDSFIVVCCLDYVHNQYLELIGQRLPLIVVKAFHAKRIIRDDLEERLKTFKTEADFLKFMQTVRQEIVS